MVNCQCEKSNSRLTLIGGRFEPRALVLVTRALTTMYTNGLLVELKKSNYIHTIIIFRKRNTKVYRGIDTIEATWTIIANMPAYN